MTGYQSAPTIGSAVSEYSTIGGLLYSFLGPMLENIAKEHLGISPQVSMFDPRSSNDARIQTMFSQSDLGAARESFQAYDKLYGAKQGNTIFGTLWNMATNKLSGQDNIAPNLYGMLIDNGVRGSWANPNKTLLENYNDSLSSRGITEQNLYDFFTDALHTRSASNISKAERSELARNYIRSNFSTLSDYSDNRNAEWLEKSKTAIKENLNVSDGVVFNSEANGYTLSKDAYNTLHDKVEALNKSLGSEKVGKGLSYEGSNSEAKKLIQDLKKLDTYAGELVSFDLDSDGKVKIIRNVKESLNKFDKEIGNYFNSIKQWSELLGTSAEGASANLNNLIGMDYAATFNNQHKFADRVATGATHINAISGKGNAFTQTAIHAAAGMLKQLGGDTSAALITGQRAALYHNPFGTRYRLNNESVDALNVTMSAGYQEAETNKLYSAMFAAGGYENTEEGRKQFFADAKKFGITPSNITFESARGFTNARRDKNNQLTASEFYEYQNVGAAQDFRAVDNTVQRMNEASMLDYAGGSVVDQVGRDTETGKQLQKVFANPDKTAEFWNAMGMQDGKARNESLKALGITMSGNDLEAKIRTSFKNDNGALGQSLMAAGGDVRAVMAHLSGSASASKREEEVKARTEASMLLKNVAGDTLMDKVVNLSQKNDISIDQLKQVATKAFAGTPYSSEVLKKALTGTKDKKLTDGEIRSRVQRMAKNLDAADKALADNEDKYGFSGEEARKKILDAVKNKRIDAKRASRLLTAVGLHGAEFDDKGNLTGLEYDANHEQKAASYKQAVSERTDELAEFMAKESQTGLSKTQLDRILVQNGEDVNQTGTAQERDLAAARIYATQQWVKSGEDFSAAKANVKGLEDRIGEKALLEGKIADGKITTYHTISGRLVSQTHQVSEEEAKKIEAFRAAHKKQQEAIALTQKLGVEGGANNGKELAWQNQERFLSKDKNVEALNAELAKNSKGIASAAEQAGIKQPTGMEGLLQQVISLLNKISDKMR